MEPEQALQLLRTKPQTLQQNQLLSSHYLGQLIDYESNSNNPPPAVAASGIFSRSP